MKICLVEMRKRALRKLMRKRHFINSQSIYLSYPLKIMLYNTLIITNNLERFHRVLSPNGEKESYWTINDF